MTEENLALQSLEDPRPWATFEAKSLGGTSQTSTGLLTFRVHSWDLSVSASWNRVCWGREISAIHLLCDLGQISVGLSFLACRMGIANPTAEGWLVGSS